MQMSKNILIYDWEGGSEQKSRKVCGGMLAMDSLVKQGQ